MKLKDMPETVQAIAIMYALMYTIKKLGDMKFKDVRKPKKKDATNKLQTKNPQ